MTQKPARADIRRGALSQLRRYNMLDTHDELLDLFELIRLVDVVWDGPDYYDTPYPSRGDLGGQEAVAWGVRKTRAWLLKVADHASRVASGSALGPMARAAVYDAVTGVDVSSSQSDYDDRGCSHNHEHIVGRSVDIYQLLLEEKYTPDRARELTKVILLGLAPSFDIYSPDEKDLRAVAKMLPMATSFYVHQRVEHVARDIYVPWWYRACVGRAEYAGHCDVAQYGALAGVGIFANEREPCLYGPGQEEFPMAPFIDAALDGREHLEVDGLCEVACRWASAVARVVVADVDPSVDAEPLIEAFLDEWDVLLRG